MMGLMNQYRQKQTPKSKLAEAIMTARGMGDPKTAIRRLADSGATCTLPDGRVMSVRDIAAMAEGKSAIELLSLLGIS